MPLVLGGGSWLALGGQPDMLRFPIVSTLSIAGLSAGHLYAGDPGRAALVSLGFPVATAAGLLLGIGFSQLAYGNNGYGVAFFGGAGAALSTVGYGAWAAVDACHTAERKNAEDSQ
jgi:hypothetical protein